MNRQQRKHHHRPSRSPTKSPKFLSAFLECVDFLANTPTTNHYANTDEVPTMLTMCRKKRNSSEATATYAQSYLLPFRTIVPIKEIMRAKFMAGCKWLLRENGRLSLQGTCHSMPKTFEVPWPCLVRFRVSHQFLVFLQFFPESFLPCLIWCLWPLKKNIFRNELNKQLNASQKTERNMFLMDDNGFEGFVLAFDIFSVERSHVEIAMLHIKKQMMGQSS